MLASAPALLATLLLSADPTGPTAAVPDAKAGEPPLSELIAAAQKENKPILIDVYTVWCKPCAQMDRDVFPRPEVQAALKDWKFQRYDAEHGHGVGVAAHFKVNQFPTLLALAPDGTEVTRIMDQEPGALVTRLRAVQADAAFGGQVSAERLAASPNDARLLFAAARAKEAGSPPAVPPNPDEAMKLYARAEAADKGNKEGIAARAAFKLLTVEAEKASAKSHGALLLAYATKYPGREAVPALEGIAALPEPARPDKAKTRAAAVKVREALVRAKEVDPLNNLAYVQMVLSDVPGGLATAEAVAKLAPDNPSYLDTLAEARYQSGQKDKAIELEKQLVAKKPGDEGLKANLARFESGAPGLPGNEFHDPLAASPAGPEAFLSSMPPEVQAMFAFDRKLADQVADLCKDRPRIDGMTFVRVYVKDGKIYRAVLMDPEAPEELRTCVSRAFEGVGSLPAGYKSGHKLQLLFPVRPGELGPAE